MTRDNVVKLARGQIGVRFYHHGREPGKRLDCSGLILHVCDEAGVKYRDPPSYGRYPEGIGLLKYFDPVFCRECDGEPNPLHDASYLMHGSIGMFWWTYRNITSHCGIIALDGKEPTLIHAFAKARQVIEEPLEPMWLPKLMKVYDFPKVEGARWPL